MSQIKKKATTFVSGIGKDICCPFFNASGDLHVVFQNSGAVKTISSVGYSKVVCTTGGQPSGATFSSDGVLYLADFGHSAVLASQGETQQELVVGVYEDRPLKGPNSICITNGDIFFTDSGSFGETGLHSPTGSLFTISNSPSGQILKPISLNNLAYPAGLVVSPNGQFIYVAEMMKNRILRFFQQPAGVFHGSVFYQLSGGVGPTSLAMDHQGQIYVGHYDSKESTSEGSVVVLSSAGKHVYTICTEGPEITGLTIHNNTLFISEKSTGSVFKMDLQ